MTRARALIDVGVALSLFLLASVLAATAASGLPPLYRMPAMVAAQGLFSLTIVGGLLAWRRQRWAGIKMVPLSSSDGARALLAFAACWGANLMFIYVLYGASPQIVEAHTERLGFIARQLAGGMPFPLLAAMLAFVGLYEEVFARGLLLDRCRSLLRGTWAPVLASSLLFGLGHLYQGWIGVAQTTLIGIVLALAVIRWGTLWPAIIAHALLDISSMLFVGGTD